VVEFLIRDVHEMTRMSAPVHRVLIDGYVHNVLNILFDDLLVKRRILVENILDGAGHFKGFVPFQKIMLLQLKSIL